MVLSVIFSSFLTLSAAAVPTPAPRVTPIPGNGMPDVRFLRKPQTHLKPVNEAARSEALEITGGPVTVIVAWASWCPFCRDQLHRLRGIYKKNRTKGLRIYALSVDESASEAAAEAEKMKYPFPVFHDADGLLKKKLDLTKLPETYVVDSNGEVVAVYRGMSNDRFNYLRKRIVSMLGQAED